MEIRVEIRVEIRAYAERIEIRQDGRVVGEHRRALGRGKTVYNSWLLMYLFLHANRAR